MEAKPDVEGSLLIKNLRITFLHATSPVKVADEHSLDQTGVDYTEIGRSSLQVAMIRFNLGDESLAREAESL